MRLQNYVTCWGTALDWLKLCQNANAWVSIGDDQSQPLRTNTKTLFRSSLSISRLWLHFIINVLNWAQQLSFVCYPIYKTDNAGPCLSLPAILSRIWFWPLAISSSFAELLQFRINEFGRLSSHNIRELGDLFFCRSHPKPSPKLRWGPNFHLYW